MTLSALLLVNEHQLIKIVHTLVSVIFLIVVTGLFYRSLIGYFRHRKYTRIDKYLSYSFLINLYLLLIMGFLLMAFPAPVSLPEDVNQAITMKLASNRFWPIEHTVLMLFALFIANLGLIFSNSSQEDTEKHRKVLIYYAISMVLIALSLGSGTIFNT